MIYLSHLFFGFLMAYVGLIPPGMLNMTSVRTAIEKGRPKAIQFSAGAASIVTLHAFIAVYFAKYLGEHPEIIEKLKIAGIFVFFGLAFFFFTQARKKFKAEGKKESGNLFVQGLFMSSINMLGIPFYLGASTLLESKGLVTLVAPNSYFLVAGAVIGAFALFSTYALFADIIVKKAAFLAKNINYVLASIFVVLGIVLSIQMFL